MRKESAGDDGDYSGPRDRGYIREEGGYEPRKSPEVQTGNLTDSKIAGEVWGIETYIST